MERRNVLLGLGGLSVMALAAACSSSDEGSVPENPDEVTGSITMWIYPIMGDGEQDYWKPKVEKFKKKYTKADVKVVVQPWANRDEQLTTAIAGGQGPDVVYLIPDQVSQYADQGVLADVSDVIADDKDDFLPNALKALTSEDTLYGVPILLSACGNLCNMAVLKQAGVTEVPTTWEQYAAIGPKVKAAGFPLSVYPATNENTLNQTFYPWLWQAGGEVLSEDGKKAAFNSDAGVEALTFIKKLIDEGFIPKEDLTAVVPAESGPYAQGKLAISLSNTANTIPLYPALKPADFQVGPPLTGKKKVGYGTVGGLSVLEGSKNATAAKAWVQWVASAEEVKEFDTTHGYYSARKSVGTLFADNPLYTAEQKLLGDLRFGVISPKARALMDLIKPQIQAALLGRAEPKQALDTAAKQVDELLARG